MDYEYVSNKSIDMACKRQERKNLKSKGTSLSFASMSNRVSQSGFIIELQSDKDIAVMKKGWREYIKSL